MLSWFTCARPAGAWITTAASHLIGVLFCCAACLEISSALEQSPTLHRGPQALWQRVNATTTLLVARARIQTCSRVHSICRRRHASPSPALMSLLQSRACTLSAELLPTPSKILPKSSCLASRGTYPWSASVESVILGVLNASLPSQSPEHDFQPLELDKLARKFDNLPRPQPPDDNLNFPRTPSPTMHSSCHSAYFPKAWGACHSAVCTNWQCLPFSAGLVLVAILWRTFSPCICVSVCENAPWSRAANTRRDAPYKDMPTQWGMATQEEMVTQDETAEWRLRNPSGPHS